MEIFHISPSEQITFERIAQLVQSKSKLALSSEAKEKINHCRQYLDQKMSRNKGPIYGINTGFGSLCDTQISDSDLEKLQYNLMKSHACGMGDEVPQEIVKLMLLLKAVGLSFGKSGVQEITVQRLIDFYNEDVIPVVYQLGSLGASGDLAPLANMCLPLIGEGEVYYKGKKVNASEVLKEKGWEKVKLKSKEGLALLNGTQFMSAFGTYILLKARKLSELSDIIGALSLEAFDGRIDPFNDLIHQIRPHQGQIKTGENFRNILAGSEIIKQNKIAVQDPYSFRCIPQVHGASKDTINYVESVFLTEINSVTDNPTIFPEEDQIISGGNFHGQPLAMTLDFIAIALHELGNISERRTYQLISGLRGLPPFLVANPGLNSGLMIPQYAAASIVSQNKQLCTPASADSIVSSNGQEDHVSMGANAATKALRITDNLERILAIELLNASQAIEFRRPLKTSPYLENFLSAYRAQVPFIEEDKILYKEIEKSVQFLSQSTVSIN